MFCNKPSAPTSWPTATATSPRTSSPTASNKTGGAALYQSCRAHSDCDSGFCSGNFKGSSNLRGVRTGSEHCRPYLGGYFRNSSNYPTAEWVPYCTADEDCLDTAVVVVADNGVKYRRDSYARPKCHDNGECARKAHWADRFISWDRNHFTIGFFWILSILVTFCLVAPLVEWAVDYISRPLRKALAKKKGKNAMVQYEAAYGKSHPITVTTLAGNAYVIDDWGSCADLRNQLAAVAPELGDPLTFALFYSTAAAAPAADGADDGADAGDGNSAQRPTPAGRRAAATGAAATAAAAAAPADAFVAAFAFAAAAATKGCYREHKFGTCWRNDNSDITTCKLVELRNAVLNTPRLTPMCCSCCYRDEAVGRDCVCHHECGSSNLDDCSVPMFDEALEEIQRRTAAAELLRMQGGRQPGDNAVVQVEQADVDGAAAAPTMVQLPFDPMLGSADRTMLFDGGVTELVCLYVTTPTSSSTPALSTTTISTARNGNSMELTTTSSGVERQPQKFVSKSSTV